MTPAELRALADEATDWQPENYGPGASEADEILVRRRADLARLCAELAQIVEKTLYHSPGWSGADVWWAEESHAALAKLAELEAR